MTFVFDIPTEKNQHKQMKICFEQAKLVYTDAVEKHGINSATAKEIREFISYLKKKYLILTNTHIEE